MLLMVVALLVVVVPGYSCIEIGQLTSQAAEELAVAKLSNGPNQESWWQLGANPHWPNESALDRFFAAAAAPPLKHVQALASQINGKRQKSGIRSSMRTHKGPTDLVGSLKNSFTTMYQMNVSVTGTGRIEVCMWTLIFQCLDPDPACSQGMVPLLIVGSAHNYSYAALWLSVTPSLLVNAIPSSLGLLPAASPVFSSHADNEYDSGLLLAINIRDSLPFCPPTAIANSRTTLLDGAYGLLPGFSCIGFNAGLDHHQSVRLLISVASSNLVIGRTIILNRRTSFSLADILSQLNVVHWKELPFEACSKAPLLGLIGDELDESINHYVCYKAFCTYLSPDFNAVSCSSYSDGVHHGELHLEAMLAAVKSLSECKMSTVPTQRLLPDCPISASQKPCKPKTMQADRAEDRTVQVSCRLAGSNVCKVSIRQDNFGVIGDHLYTFNPVSNWSSTEGGANTRKFQQSGQEGVKKAQPCIDVPRYASQTFQKEVPQTIQIRAKADLTSYIAEHNIAFTTANGPATDRYTFIALIVSTAISVILAVSWPFTNFLLKQICRHRPLYLCSQKAHPVARRVAKVSMLIIFNMVLSIVFFLPVLSVALDEIERKKPFYTWDLGSGDLDVLHDVNLPQKFRVIYLFSATSNYDSHFLRAITIVIALTCITVAACTAWRCKQIFARYRLLQQENAGIMVEVGLSAVPNDQLVVDVLLHMALKAIEMTDAESLAIAIKMRKK